MKKIIILFLLLVISFSTEAAEKIKAVASFSILADIVQNVGGSKVEVISLVDPDSDAHVFEPKPFHAKIIAGSDVVFVNGLGFEGWINRLVEQSGYRKEVVVVSRGVKAIETHDGEHHESQHEHGNLDPHIWHDVKNAVIMVKNIEAGLIKADEKNAGYYKENAGKYISRLKKLDEKVKKSLAEIPEKERKVITSHDAFGYYAKAYKINFIAPQGISTESEASAQDVAKIVEAIKKYNVKAIFVENIADKKLLEQMAKEAKVKIYGKLYSDALSHGKSEAGDYISLIEHNTEILIKAMK